MNTPVYIDGIHAADLDQSGPHTLVVSERWPAEGKGPVGHVCAGQRIPVGRVVATSLTNEQAARDGKGAMGYDAFRAWVERTLLGLRE